MSFNYSTLKKLNDMQKPQLETTIVTYKSPQRAIISTKNISSYCKEFVKPTKTEEKVEAQTSVTLNRSTRLSASSLQLKSQHSSFRQSTLRINDILDESVLKHRKFSKFLIPTNKFSRNTKNATLYGNTSNYSRVQTIYKQTFLDALVDALILVKFPDEPLFGFSAVSEVFLDFSQNWFAFKQLFGYKSLLSLAHHFTLIKKTKSQIFDKFSPLQFTKEKQMKCERSIIRSPDLVVKCVHQKQFNIFLEFNKNVDKEKSLMRKRRQKRKEQIQRDEKIKERAEEEQREIRRRMTRRGM